MFTVSTCNFVSRRAAIRYYGSYNYDPKDVDLMIEQGAIHIGPPIIKQNEKLILLDNETHYGIVGQ